MPIARLGEECFSHDDVYHALRGGRSGGVLALGDRVRVELTEIDAARGQLTFRPLDDIPGPAGRAATSHRGRRRRAPRGVRRSLSPMSERLRPGAVRWSVAALIATSAVVGMTISFSVPLLSLILESRGVEPELIGVNAAAGGIAVFVLAPWLPRLINRFGVVASMAAGQLLCIACFVLLPIKVDLSLWFTLRLMIGLGTAVVWVASQAAAHAMIEDASRGRVMAIGGTLFGIGYAIGPALITLVGSAGVLPFALCIALLVLGLLPLVVVRGTRRAMSEPSDSGLLGVMRLAPLPLAAVLLFGLLENASFAFLPLYGLRLGYPETQAALLLTALLGGSILFLPPIGWLADRTSRRGLLLGCGAATLLAALLWPLGLPDRILAWPLLVVSGGAVGGLYAVSLTLLGQQFRGGGLLVAYTMSVMMYQVGAIAGPTLAGVVIGAFGMQGLPTVLAIASGLFLAAAILLARRRPGSA